MIPWFQKITNIGTKEKQPNLPGNVPLFEWAPGLEIDPLPPLNSQADQIIDDSIKDDISLSFDQPYEDDRNVVSDNESSTSEEDNSHNDYGEDNNEVVVNQDDTIFEEISVDNSEIKERDEEPIPSQPFAANNDNIQPNIDVGDNASDEDIISDSDGNISSCDSADHTFSLENVEHIENEETINFFDETFDAEDNVVVMEDKFYSIDDDSGVLFPSHGEDEDGDFTEVSEEIEDTANIESARPKRERRRYH